jgi:hypothetical protein
MSTNYTSVNKSFLPTIQSIFPIRRRMRRIEAIIPGYCPDGYTAGVPNGPMVYTDHLQYDTDIPPFNSRNVRGFLWIPVNFVFEVNPLRSDVGGTFISSTPSTYLTSDA